MSIQRALGEIDWNRTLSLLNSVSFVSFGIDEWNLRSDPRLLPNERAALTYSAALLGIAGAHYAALEVSRPLPETEIVIRYSDWLLTTPLLLMVVASLYEFDRATTVLLITLDVLMIAFGFIYEETNNRWWWALGTAAYIGLLIVLGRALPAKDIFYQFFVIGWAAYGLVALLPLEQRFVLFNLLDFYNKFVFAVVINGKIKARLAQS